MPIRNNLRDIRFDLRMDQNEFAKFIGVNKTHYHKWEHQLSQPSLEWAIKIAQKVQKPVEDIFFFITEDATDV